VISSGRRRYGGGAEERRSYRRSLGLLELVSLGVGGTIGSGIFVVQELAAGIAVRPPCWPGSSSRRRRRACNSRSRGSGAVALGTTFGDFCSVFGRAASAALSPLYRRASPVATSPRDSVIFLVLLHSHVLLVRLVCRDFSPGNVVGIQAPDGRERLRRSGCVEGRHALARTVRSQRNLIAHEVASVPDLVRVAIIVYWPSPNEIGTIPVETQDPRASRAPSCW
jgi:hypothetical protein